MTSLYIFYQNIFGYFTRHRLKSQELGLANAVIASTVYEVDRTELTELDGFEAFGIENGFFDLLHIEVILMPFQAHQHLHPVQAVVTWMKRSFDVSNSDIILISLALRIIVDVIHKISWMIDRLEVFLLPDFVAPPNWVNRPKLG